MAIQFPCNCGKTLRVDDKFAGKKIKCASCKKVVVVPKSSVPPKAAPKRTARMPRQKPGKKRKTERLMKIDRPGRPKKVKVCKQCGLAIPPSEPFCPRCSLKDIEKAVDISKDKERVIKSSGRIKVEVKEGALDDVILPKIFTPTFVILVGILALFSMIVIVLTLLSPGLPNISTRYQGWYKEGRSSKKRLPVTGERIFFVVRVKNTNTLARYFEDYNKLETLDEKANYLKRFMLKDEDDNKYTAILISDLKSNSESEEAEKFYDVVFEVDRGEERSEKNTLLIKSEKEKKIEKELHLPKPE